MPVGAKPTVSVLLAAAFGILQPSATGGHMTTQSPGMFSVQRSTKIAASASTIFPFIDDLKRWQQWSPWEGLDPNMERTYSGADRGVGSAYAWRGNRKVGMGRMTIVEAASPNSADIQLDFLKPFKATNHVRIELLPVSTGGEVQVSWTMTGKKTLMTRVIGIFKSMDAMVGPDFERGLAQLKAVSEAASG